MESKSEKLFKEAAAAYVKREGEALISELAAMESAPDYDYGTNAYKPRKRFVVLKIISGAIVASAACVLAVVIMLRPYTSDKADRNTEGIYTRPRVEIVNLSASLPDGYVLEKTDYDNEKTVYYITNERNNEIVLVAEEKDRTLSTEGFAKIKISGSDAYVMVRRDYRVLRVNSGDMTLTLTSRFDENDLIEIVRNIL